MQLFASVDAAFTCSFVIVFTCIYMISKHTSDWVSVKACVAKLGPVDSFSRCNVLHSNSPSPIQQAGILCKLPCRDKNVNKTNALKKACKKTGNISSSGMQIIYMHAVIYMCANANKLVHLNFLCAMKWLTSNPERAKSAQQQAP